MHLDNELKALRPDVGRPSPTVVAGHRRALDAAIAEGRTASRRGPTAAQRSAFRARSTVGATSSTALGFPYDNELDAWASVSCTDGMHPWSASFWPNLVTKAERSAPDFGAVWAWQSAVCARSTWTARDEDRYRGPFTRRTSAPVLLVGTVNDPATPYAGAQAAARLLPSSRLLTSVGFGHTAFGTSTCVDSAVEQYLLTGRTPRRGTTCRAVLPFTRTLDERAGLGGAPAAALALRGTTGPTRKATPAPASDVLRRRPPIAPLHP